MKIAVSQSIDCAHQLPGTELHGHTYRVTWIMDNSTGFDGGFTFEKLKEILGSVLGAMDHRKLEHVIGEPATAERLAECIQFGVGFGRIRVEVGDAGWVETE